MCAQRWFGSEIRKRRSDSGPAEEKVLHCEEAEEEQEGVGGWSRTGGGEELRGTTETSLVTRASTTSLRRNQNKNSISSEG